VTNQSLVEQAERLTQEGSYQEAIDAYQRHIDERLTVRDKPEWENPHFYLLRIIDLQLRMSDPKAALATCKKAEQLGVEASLVSDRYRAIASWYSERGELKESFEVLKAHRDQDPLLFDAMLDRLGREMTAKGM
jgi:tetratricopeptide (TPR) repeat protein